jgi:hypothetical protein
LHSTTIVLPVHNMERFLRPEVMRILDLAEILGRRISVAIVDDGSHDGTFEAACELARQFPQVHVVRQPYQRGLGAALEQVRLRLRVDRVVAHDGVAAIDLNELADVLAAPEGTAAPAAAVRQAADDGRGSRRLGGALHAKPGSGKAGSFRWLRLDEPVTPRRSRAFHPASAASASYGVAAIGGATAFTAPAGLAT